MNGVNPKIWLVMWVFLLGIPNMAFAQHRPVADARADKTVVNIYDTATLDGRYSYDPDSPNCDSLHPEKLNDGISLYWWSIVSGPQEVMSNPSTYLILHHSVPSSDSTEIFAPPQGIAGNGPIFVTFNLEVTNQAQFPNENIAEVTVRINRRPIAVAQDQSVTEGNLVTLDGSASTDPDNDTLTYSWVGVGNSVPLTDIGQGRATFVAPCDASLTFRLTVTDTNGLTDSKDVTIFITPLPVIRYVDKANQDGPWYGSETYPYATIADALSEANSDPSIDIIEVRASNPSMDIYEENLALRNNLTLRAEVRRAPLIKGTVRMANNTKLEGFRIEKATSGDPTVIVEGVSNVEIAHNTIKIEVYAPNDTICALKVLQPAFTNPGDSINIHNNIILTRATGDSTTGLGLALVQSNPNNASYIVPLEGIKVVNNTIDITSDKFAYGIYAKINNYYNPETKATGIVVKNNIISSPAGTRTQPNYCIDKVQSGLGTYLPIKYNDCFLRNKGRSDDEVSTLVEPFYQMEKDPQYEDYENNDFHLNEDSPCIDAGDPEGDYSGQTDIDGEQRVMLGRVDMGADEFNPIRLGIVSKKRVARTEFAYDCNATFTNLWPFAVKNVELQMMQAPENMTIIEPNVTFGDIQFNTRQSITSTDTCTIIVDREEAIDADKIVWRIRCKRADTGMPIELTINGVGSSGLESAGEGKIGLEDLAELAGQWLWVGPAGSIPEDITGDGIVNFRDFAVLGYNPR